VQWQSEQTHWIPSRLVFLDETGAATNMTRHYGRAARGQRCVASGPAWAPQDHDVYRRASP